LGKEERKSSGLGAHQNQALLPCLVVRKCKKRVKLTLKIRPGKRYSMMKKKSEVPLQLQVTKSGQSIKKQTALFALIRVI